MKYVHLITGCLAAAICTAGGDASAPPPTDDEPEVIELFNVNEERADRIAEEFLSEDPTCPNYDQRAQIVVPVTQRDVLIGYAFVTPRFCLARGVNRFQIDDRMHFIFDNLVRAAHRTPFERLDDDTIDKTAASEALLTAAQDVIGSERLERLDLLGSDVRFLR